MRKQGKSPSFSLLLHKGLNRMGKPQWFGFELKCELWTRGSFSSNTARTCWLEWMGSLQFESRDRMDSCVDEAVK
ncbi:hypothetical protein Bca4012_028418 [Brassica carinata]